MFGIGGIAMDRMLRMFQTIQGLYRKKSTLFHMIFSYLLLGMIMISIFSIVLVDRVTDEITTEIQENSEKRVYQSYTTANILLTHAFQQFYETFHHDDVLTEAMYGKDLDRIAIGKISMKLDQLVETNPLVHSIYLYNYQDQLVFSSLTTVQTIDQFFDQDMNQKVQQVTESGGTQYFIPAVERFSILGKEYNHRVISVIFSSTTTDSFSHGLLVVNFNQSLFQQLVTQGHGSSSSNIMIVDQQGTIISQSNERWSSDNIMGETYMNRIMQSDSKTGTFIEYINGKKAMITFEKSDSLGWVFIDISDYEGLISRAELLKRFIMTITVVFVLIGGIVGALYVNRLYKPIQRLLGKVSVATVNHDTNQKLGEFDTIVQSIDTLEDRIRLLQSNLKEHLPESQKSYLLAILHGEWQPSVTAYNKLKKVGIEIEEGTLIVLVFKLDKYNDLLKRYSLYDLSLIKYAMTNIAEEVGGRSYAVEVVDGLEDSISMIISCGEYEHVINLAKDIQQSIMRYLSISVTIGIGTMCERFDQLQHSWHAASQAAQYRLICGIGKVITYEKILGRKDYMTYEYPIHIERRTIECLKAGDLTKLEQGVDEFVAYIRNMRVEEIQLALSQLMVITLRTSIEMVMDSTQLVELQEAHHRILYFDTLDEIRQWYIQLCGQIIQMRNTLAANKCQAHIERILAIIHERYVQANFSVTALAEEVGLSINYVRKLFKDNTGKSLSTYINECRFKRAQKLLINTQLPANKIGEMVGMSNPSYFYVAFKKFTGKTPDLFRKEAALKK